jgi:peptide-methionine (S)-S-oxide reductase
MDRGGGAEVFNKPELITIDLVVCLHGLCFELREGKSRGNRQREPSMIEKEKKRIDKATFAAGCFWGVEAAFSKVRGVVSTEVGYTGGHLKNPTYGEVCSGSTGHAEAVQVQFDPSQVSYEQLLEVFWAIHDPTALNRQGPDVGTQYRSVIFYHNEEQRTAAVASREKLGKRGRHKNPIVTEIRPASEFFRAEEYHQRYLEKRGPSGCHI